MNSKAKSKARTEYRLTTDHKASVDGVPVLVRDDGAVFGPNDGVMSGNVEARACDFARWMQRYYGFDPALVGRFRNAGGRDPRLDLIARMASSGLGKSL